MEVLAFFLPAGHLKIELTEQSDKGFTKVIRQIGHSILSSPTNIFYSFSVKLLKITGRRISGLALKGAVKIGKVIKTTFVTNL